MWQGELFKGYVLLLVVGVVRFIDVRVSPPAISEEKGKIGHCQEGESTIFEMG